MLLYLDLLHPGTSGIFFRERRGKGREFDSVLLSESLWLSIHINFFYLVIFLRFVLNSLNYIDDHQITPYSTPPSTATTFVTIRRISLGEQDLIGSVNARLLFGIICLPIILRHVWLLMKT